MRCRGNALEIELFIKGRVVQDEVGDVEAVPVRVRVEDE